jgi:hypothetical protein
MTDQSRSVVDMDVCSVSLFVFLWSVCDPIR